MNVARAELPPHLTSIGQSPSVVLVPTVQVHDALPAASAVFGVRPVAELGPLAYVTVIVHDAPGSVATVTAAAPPRDTGDRTDVKRTNAPGVGVGVGDGVRVTVGVGDGLAVADEVVVVALLGRAVDPATSPVLVGPDDPQAHESASVRPSDHLRAHGQRLPAGLRSA